MKELSGMIFDIQSYSVHDGPGCRTTVFLKGCFLNCEWCANPESWRKDQQLMFADSKCKRDSGCEMCVDACPYNSISISKDNSISLNWDLCSKCTTFECTEACYYEALRVCGKKYKVSELMRILNRDRQFWQSSGGVTFSGGEPFYQKDFLIQVLKECRDSYIHTAIETTACIDTETFMEAMKYIDFAFIDIKHMNRYKHKEKTGVYNDIILKNIEELSKSNWQGRLVLRMPVIRDYNDTDDNIHEIINFMKKLNLFEINILPFHRLGSSKWNQQGKEYSYAHEKETSNEKMEHIQELFLDNEIACYKGYETTF